jgi:hypothetical protein
MTPRGFTRRTSVGLGLYRKGGDSIPPLLLSIVIPANGLTMVMTYDEPLDETSVPATTDYSVSGTSAGISSLVVSGSTVTHTMDDTIKQGETVLSTYTAGVNPVRDLAENNAANLTNQATTNNSEVSAYVAEYLAVYNAFENTPSDADAAAQNAYVKAGVDDGWWGDGDREFVFASHASGRDSLLDWLDPTNNAKVATLVNAPAWVQYQGYTGNGSSSYINSNYTPSTDAVNFAQDSASFGVYIRSDVNGFQIDAGTYGSGSKNYIVSRSSNNYNLILNSADLALASAQINSQGLTCVNRAVAGTVQGYKNGSFVNDRVLASAAVTNIPFYILAGNLSSGPFLYSTRQQSMNYYSGSLDAAKHLSKYNAFQTLMTYYGTQV